MRPEKAKGRLVNEDELSPEEDLCPPLNDLLKLANKPKSEWGDHVSHCSICSEVAGLLQDSAGSEQALNRFLAIVKERAGRRSNVREPASFGTSLKAWFALSRVRWSAATIGAAIALFGTVLFASRPQKSEQGKPLTIAFERAPEADLQTMRDSYARLSSNHNLPATEINNRISEFNQAYSALRGRKLTEGQNTEVATLWLQTNLLRDEIQKKMNDRSSELTQPTMPMTPEQDTAARKAAVVYAKVGEAYAANSKPGAAAADRPVEDESKTQMDDLQLWTSERAGVIRLASSQVQLLLVGENEIRFRDVKPDRSGNEKEIFERTMKSFASRNNVTVLVDSGAQTLKFTPQANASAAPVSSAASKPN
jgi:hypothetical protein